MFSNRTYDYKYTLPPAVNGIVSLEDIQRISPFFTPTNAVTYAVFLEANKDKLTQDEIERTKNILGHLMMSEDELMREISQQISERNSVKQTEDEIHLQPMQPINEP